MAGEKHLPYYRLLESFKEKGCPFCGLLSKSLDKYLEGLLYEHVNDSQIRQILRESRGFCNVHAEKIQSFGDSFGLGIIYHDILSSIASQINISLEAGFKRDTFKQLGRQTLVCPACSHLQDVEHRYLGIFAKYIDDIKIEIAYERSDGLCLHHFVMIMKIIKSKRKKEFIAQVQDKKIKAISEQLEEFIRKHDYRFSGKGYTEEADSWLRAVEMVSGRVI